MRKSTALTRVLRIKIDLTIRQDVFILLIKVTRARIRFQKVVKDIKILIEKVIIYIFIFVVSRFNYEILLKQLF